MTESRRANLTEDELHLIRTVLTRHRATGAILYGSRAKGTASPGSDVDLALEGIDDPLRAESIAGALDELPLPYRFDVKALSRIRSGPLLDHIARVGIRILGPGPSAAEPTGRDPSDPHREQA